MKKPFKETTSGGVLSPAESTPMNFFNDNPLVRTIKEYFEDKLKDAKLVRIQENGEIYTIDVRFRIEEADVNTQYAREQGKQRAYDIKRELEVSCLHRFNIPAFSIQGVNIVKLKDGTYCEFVISLIYANVGNLKPTNESSEKDQRVRALVESALKEKKTIVKEVDPLEEMYAEAKELEESILEDLNEDDQFQVAEGEELEEGYKSPDREQALNFLERMGTIKRKEEE